MDMIIYWMADGGETNDVYEEEGDDALICSKGSSSSAVQRLKMIY